MSAPALVLRSTGVSGGAGAVVQDYCARHERALLCALLAVAATLRVAIAIGSPTPFGYVYDFYHDAVAWVYDHGALPPPSACWICAHPPLFWIIGTPFYALGMLLSHGDRATAERMLCLLPLLCDAAVVLYTYRLLRLYKQRGVYLLSGMALCALLPCLVISSHAPESDILLTALMVTGVFHLARLHVRAPRAGWPDALWLGALSGLSALTKYSGLLLLIAAMAVLAARLWTRPGRRRTLQQAATVCALALVIGGSKYVYNLRVHHELLIANGSAHEGFDVLGLGPRRQNFDQYEFTTLRLPEVLELFAEERFGLLTYRTPYESVWTTLHAQAWTDMSFFSVRSRHGDPHKPYPPKHVPLALIAVVLYLGLLPSVLAVIGGSVAFRRRSLWPLSFFAATTFAAYLWWVIAQEAWALKTKYILFLLPVYVLFALIGLRAVASWHGRPGRIAIGGSLSGLLALAVACVAYLGWFALG